MTTEVTNVVQGKWGFYSCSSETCFKLKKLNAYYVQAQHSAAAWWRWARKLPKNRKGNPPKLNPVFLSLIPTGSHSPLGGNRSLKTWFADKEQKNYYYVNMPNKYEMKNGKYGTHLSPCGFNNNDTIFVKSFDIPLVYRLARRPVAEATQIKPLTLTVEEIDKLLAGCEAWEAQNKP